MVDNTVDEREVQTSGDSTWTNDAALLVIDVQKGVVSGGWDCDGVVSRIRGLIDHARTIEVPVIYIQHEDPAYPAMARGGEDWQICDEIAPREGEIVIPKQYPDSFAETDLAATLDDLGIRNLIITGAQSDACVRATTYRAIADGYGVTLVSDCHTTSDREYEGEVIPARQIVAHVNAATPWITYPGRAPRLTKQAVLLASPHAVVV